MPRMRAALARADEGGVGLGDLHSLRYLSDLQRPRSGRELEVFHIANAYLQNASVNALDCDVSMEISNTADKNAPRMIVETPVDSEYCSARQNLQAQLKKHGFLIDSQHGGELPKALPVDVVGMAFEDFEHDRGQVATLWEIHPAIVTAAI
jgi:hypothetical protein